MSTIPLNINPAAPQPAERLASLLLLQKKFREAANREGLYYLLVNDSQVIVPYRTAILWHSGKVVAVSSLPYPAADAPFTLWVSQLCTHLSSSGKEVKQLIAQDVPEDLRSHWAEFFPAQALWMPGQRGDGLLLARDQPWQAAEIELFRHVTDSGLHALRALEHKTIVPWHAMKMTPQRRKRLQLAGGLCAALLLLPVKLSVVAPAAVDASDAFIVRAPLAGVIGDIVVAPNSVVKKGDVLLALNDQELKSQQEVAKQALAVARSEYATAQQAAITSSDAQATLNVLQGRVEQREAELAEVENQLKRVTITADRAGVALIPDITTLKGKPVRVGEKIMTVADPEKAEIEMWVPVADSIELPDKAEVEFYVNVAPNHSVGAELTTLNYQASLSPDGILAFRATAHITDKEKPRLGLHGTAKVYGDRVPLFYYLFRKPLTLLRKWTGL